MLRCLVVAEPVTARQSVPAGFRGPIVLLFLQSEALDVGSLTPGYSFTRLLKGLSPPIAAIS